MNSRQFFLILTVSCSFTKVIAENPLADQQINPSFPTPVLSPSEGVTNKMKVDSEASQMAFAELPNQPTQNQLEKIEMDGLRLTSISDTDNNSDITEEKLATALKAYGSRKNPDDASALGEFISQNPASPWTPTVRITYGTRLYHQARFSEALEHFEQAWNALKDSDSPKVREASVFAAAELASLYARLGRMEELRRVLNDVEGRPISGSNTEKIRMAAEGLEAMTTTPEHSFKCGPYALRNIRESLGLQPFSHRLIDEKKSTVKGIALSELQALAGEMDMDWVAAERISGAKLPLPTLVHWKVGHYAAVIKEMEDGRLLVRDPTFMHDFLIAPDVLDRESTGHFLIPRAALSNGWKLLSIEAAANVYGKGAPSSNDPDDSKDKCKSDKKCGMAAYDFDFYKAGLIIMDTPLWYDAPYGPSIAFSLTYRQRGEQVLDSSSYGFGPKWTSNLSLYLQQADSAGNMVVFLPAGERETHTFNPTSGQFDRQKRNLRKLVKTSTAPITYELQNTDGSKFIFSRSVSTGGYPKYLLSSFSDPQGKTITLSYNSSNRLIAVTDSLGQVSNFYYENASFPHLVTKISDPFIPSSGIRRSALLAYDSSGRLVKITDPEGIESSFTYHPTQTDFITSLTTPYGKTSFVTNPATETNQYVEVTDPLNRKERVEYRHSFSGILPGSDPAAELPDDTLIKSNNNYLYYGNTLYWDKKTYVHFPPDPETGLNYDKAVRYKWMWHSTVNQRTIGVISNIKMPFENRIWYEYPNQVSATFSIQIGSSELPSKIGSRINATETQIEQYEYNDLGNTTKHTDTLGRINKAEYDSTGMDLLSVKMQNGTADETLATFTYDPSDPPRLPRTFTDAAGQTSTFSWNTRSQIATATQPGNLITTWNYQTTGYLSSIDGPLADTSDTTNYTHDLYGRVRTVTSPGGHTLTYDYDALDRPTLVTYPDGTKEQFSYQREDGKKILDLTHHKDRENRWTLFAYNALRQRTAIVDPLNRVTQFNWCYCGSLQDLYDPEGKRTQWSYDIGARLTGKTYADGRQEIYTYDLAGRLDKITDAKGQVKTHSYYKDSQLKEIAYSNSQVPTANVGFTYEAIYGGLATMNDGTGITNYTYHPVGQLGALMPATVDGPLANDIIAFTYDAQSRLKTHSIHGTANTTSIDAYDNLGRITQLTNPLGTFQHTYDPVNLLPKTITAPNGMVTEFSYMNTAADLRLQEIKHTLPGNAPLSKHNYEYRKNGNINSWQRQIGTDPETKFSIGYDKVDQLTSATLAAVANPNTPLESHSFQYDKSGNRTSRQNGNVVESATYNNTNALTSTQAGGKMRIAGVTDEHANVKVNGKPALTNAQKQYEAWVDVAAGENTLTIEAEDFSYNQNKRIKSWTVNVTGTAKTPAYDLNGNTLTDGTGKSYVWDAENRLTKIIYADNSSTEFQYNGLSQRVRVIEKSADNATLSDKRYLWAGGTQPAEERDATGTTVLKRYFPQGEQIPAAAAPLNKLFYTKDHLGNIRELTDSNGTLQTRYDYDMWGKRVKLSGTLDTEVGYTGHHHHAKSGLILTWFRAYDAEQGRWLSADPIEEAGGLNLYGYVVGNPMNKWDSYGLCDSWIGLEGEIASPFGGFALALGGVIDWDNLEESGIAFSIGPAVGLSAGIAAGVSHWEDEMEGTSIEVDVNGGPVSVAIPWDEKYGNMLESCESGYGAISGTVGPGVGAAVARTTTHTLSLAAIEGAVNRSVWWIEGHLRNWFK